MRESLMPNSSAPRRRQILFHRSCRSRRRRLYLRRHRNRIGINLWREWARLEVGAGKQPYQVPAPRTIMQRHSFSRSPRTSRYFAYSDPEITYRVTKYHHAGFILKSKATNASRSCSIPTPSVSKPISSPASRFRTNQALSFIFRATLRFTFSPDSFTMLVDCPPPCTPCPKV